MKKEKSSNSVAHRISCIPKLVKEKFESCRVGPGQQPQSEISCGGMPPDSSRPIENIQKRQAALIGIQKTYQVRSQGVHLNGSLTWNLASLFLLLSTQSEGQIHSPCEELLASRLLDLVFQLFHLDPSFTFNHFYRPLGLVLGFFVVTVPDTSDLGPRVGSRFCALAANLNHQADCGCADAADIPKHPT